MKFKLLIALFTLFQCCIKGKNSDLRVNVQNAQVAPNELVETGTESDGKIRLEFEVEKEKQRLLDIIRTSDLTEEEKNQAITYIESYEFESLETVRQFIDEFLVKLIKLLPEKKVASIKVVTDATLVATDNIAGVSGEKLQKLRRDILREVMAITILEKDLTEEDVKDAIKSVVESSGYWNIEEFATVNDLFYDELIDNPAIKEMLAAEPNPKTPAQEPNTPITPDSPVQPEPTAPTAKATSLNFTDEDYDAGELSGSLSITKASDETEITGYSLFWGPDTSAKLEDTAFVELDKTGSDFSYTFSPSTSIPNGATHFLVYTKNEVGLAEEPLALAILDKTAPPTPQNLDATAGDNQVSLTFTSGDGSTSGFLLIRKMSEAVSFIPNHASSYTNGQDLGNGHTVVYSGSSFTYTDTSAANTNTYHYALYASDDNLHYSLSAVTASATPQDTTLPPAPVSIDDTERYNSTTESANISWVAPADTSDINHYEIALGTSAGGTDILDWTNVGTSTTYQHTGAIPNGEIVYASVRSVDAASNPSTAVLGDGYQNLECPNDTSTNGVGIYIKVHGNTTPGLGGKHYLQGTQTLLDWTGANPGNNWTPTQSTRKLSDFCVAKYEMKMWHQAATGTGFADRIIPDPQDTNIIPETYDFEGTNGGTHTDRSQFRAVSAPEGGPWVEIKVGLGGTIGAFQACANLGSNYMLINNAQWQAIARDIEATAANWDTSDGDANNHHINRGHSDDTPSNALLNADITGPDFDDDPCIGTGQSCSADPANNSDADFTQKRTHTLSSTSSALWDFAGNVWEWVSDLNHQPEGHGILGADASDFIAVEPFVGNDDSDKAEFKLQWGTTLDHSLKTLNERGGFGYLYGDSTPGGDTSPSTPGSILRGGRWNSDNGAGPFGLSLYYDASFYDSGRGFRCNYAP